MRKEPDYIIIDECNDLSEEDFNKLGATLDKVRGMGAIIEPSCQTASKHLKKKPSRNSQPTSQS
jgi:hypothetical protein